MNGSRTDNFNRANPSSRQFGSIVGLAQKVMEWRFNLPKFYEEVTGHQPFPYQAEFLNEMADLGNQYALISAGRGTGKTEALSVLAIWYVFVLPLTDPGTPMKVVILAGSEKQAKICYSYVTSFIQRIDFLKDSLAKQPTENEVLFKDGSYIRPLTASEKSVRGPHPDILIIDEACQADDDLITAAMPMIGTSRYPRLVFSSTPDVYYSLFVKILNGKNEFTEFQRFVWSAEDCPTVGKGFLSSQKKWLDSGKFGIEYLGIPYSFSGRVFPLEQLRECVKYRGLIREKDGPLYAGVDWGYSPAPTVLTIVQQLKKGRENRWRVIHTSSYLAENFAIVLNKLEKIVKMHEVLALYCDSSHPGENQRLAAKGLPVFPVKFKSQKNRMLSNLKALVENENIEIDGERDYPLVAQLRDYSYDTKRNDDFVDSLMLAVKEGSKYIVREYSLKDFISAIPRARPTTSPRLSSRNVKPIELMTEEEKKKLKEKRKGINPSRIIR